MGILVATIGLALMGTGSAQGQRAPRATPENPGGALVWVDPPRRIVVGRTLHLDVRIRGALDIGSVPFTLVFDPEAIELLPQEAQEGPFLGRDGAGTVFLVSPAGTAGGLARVTVGLSRLGGGPGISGRGLLCRIPFRLKRPGPTTVSFTRARLLDASAVPRPGRFEGATLSAGEAR